MKRTTVIAVGVCTLMSVEVGAYIIPARSVFRRFAEKQALDRVESGPLSGRAAVAQGPGEAREVPVQVDMQLPGGCRATLELPEGKATATLANGRVTTEGLDVPALTALVALGCPLAAMKNVPATEAETALLRMAGGLGVDLALVSLGRLESRVAFAVGARPRDLSSPQIWFDKATNRPVRVIARHGGQVWDVRYADPRSIATGRKHPRKAEVWRDGQRWLALRLMSGADKTGAGDDPEQATEEGSP